MSAVIIMIMDHWAMDKYRTGFVCALKSLKSCLNLCCIIIIGPASPPGQPFGANIWMTLAVWQISSIARIYPMAISLTAVNIDIIIGSSFVFQKQYIYSFDAIHLGIIADLCNYVARCDLEIEFY